MMNKALFFFVLLSFPFLPMAQEMTTSVAKDKLEVGEPFKIKFEMEIKPSDEAKTFPSFDSLLVFKVNNETNKKDSNYFLILSNLDSKKEKIQGKFYWTSKYEVLGFEEGYFIIPPQDFELNGKKILSNPKMVTVSLIDKKKDVDLYDIEESFTELPSPLFENLQQVIFWGFLLIVIVGLVLIFYFFIYKKNPKTEEIPIEDKNWKKNAVDDLDELMNRQLWDKGELKMHFTEVSLIARQYLSNETKQSFMEKTSLETQLILRNKGVPESHLKPLGLILNVSDMVKFAKSSLEKEGIWSVYQETKKFIEEFDVR